MIISFSVRDNHPEDMKIIKWYNGMEKSERSRSIRSLILYVINHEMSTEPVQTSRPRKPTLSDGLKMIELPIENEPEIDLDSKLDNMLGGRF